LDLKVDRTPGLQQEEEGEEEEEEEEEWRHGGVSGQCYRGRYWLLIYSLTVSLLISFSPSLCLCGFLSLVPRIAINLAGLEIIPPAHVSCLWIP
jgi:hypothetical protein